RWRGALPHGAGAVCPACPGACGGGGRLHVAGHRVHAAGSGPAGGGDRGALVISLVMQQRTPEWYQARTGRVTGSRAADVIARLKNGGEAAARRDLRAQLTIERLTGRPLDTGGGYISSDMRVGMEGGDEGPRHAGGRR